MSTEEQQARRSQVGLSLGLALVLAGLGLEGTKDPAGPRGPATVPLGGVLLVGGWLVLAVALHFFGRSGAAGTTSDHKHSPP